MMQNITDAYDLYDYYSATNTTPLDCFYSYPDNEVYAELPFYLTCRGWLTKSEYLRFTHRERLKFKIQKIKAYHKPFKKLRTIKGTNKKKIIHVGMRLK